MRRDREAGHLDVAQADADAFAREPIQAADRQGVGERRRLDVDVDAALEVRPAPAVLGLGALAVALQMQRPSRGGPEVGVPGPPGGVEPQAVGEAEPRLAVTPQDQRYTALTPGSLYRFESPGSGFTADLPVDEDGLVLDYPGLFRRLA